jgi:hypothetical protein
MPRAIRLCDIVAKVITIARAHIEVSSPVSTEYRISLLTKVRDCAKAVRRERNKYTMDPAIIISAAAAQDRPVMVSHSKCAPHQAKSVCRAVLAVKAE